MMSPEKNTPQTMIEALSISEGSESSNCPTLATILLQENISQLRTLLKSCPTGILVTGSDHFTRRLLVDAAAPCITFSSGSRFVQGDRPKKKLPTDGVICIEDLDAGDASLEGYIKGLFFPTHSERIVVGLASSDARVPASLLRAGRFERIHRVFAPSIDARQEAWNYILHTILRTDHQFKFPQEAPTELAAISPGYGMPDFLKIMYRFVSPTCLAGPSQSLFQESPFVYEELKEVLASHQPLSGSADLNFVTSNAHAPSSEFLSQAQDWGDHVGYEKLKQSLIRLCEWPVSYSETFKRLGVTPPSGVLLHGPHGCGKTMLAMSLLRRLRHANWLHVHAPDLFSKYLGESEAHIRSLFARARQLAPCMVFIDELDAIGASRDVEDGGGSGVEKRVLGSLLTELDGVTGGQTFVLGCASDIKRLDVALVRPGRLDHVEEVGRPGAVDRRAILEMLLKDVPVLNESNALFDFLVQETDGMTGADLFGFCREAAMLAVEDENKPEGVTFNHFEQALQALKASGKELG